MKCSYQESTCFGFCIVCYYNTHTFYPLAYTCLYAYSLFSNIHLLFHKLLWKLEITFNKIYFKLLSESGQWWVIQWHHTPQHNRICSHFMIIIYKILCFFKKSHNKNTYKKVENNRKFLLNCTHTLTKIAILTLFTNNKVQRNKNMHNNDLFLSQNVLHHFDLLFYKESS